MKYITKIIKNNAGAVLIEMAIALPVLLLLIFGGIELGLYFIKQHITARAVDSVVIPLQLNPNDPRREIEMQIRNSGMGFIVFSLGNKAGNYICVRAYSDFANAQKNLCKPINSFDDGWHPEASHWLLNPIQPYYLAIVAHVEYKNLLGMGAILPPINEYHVFQVSPSIMQNSGEKFIPPAVPQAISREATTNNPTAGDNADINAAAQQLQKVISSMQNFNPR